MGKPLMAFVVYAELLFRVRVCVCEQGCGCKDVGVYLFYSFFFCASTLACVHSLVTACSLARVHGPSRAETRLT